MEVRWCAITDRIRAAVAVGLALGAPGCASQVPDDGEDGSDGEASGPSADASSSSATTTSGASTTSTSTASTMTTVDPATGPPPIYDLGDGPRFDFGSSTFDIGTPQTECFPPDTGAPACEVPLPPTQTLVPFCASLADEQACEDLTEEEWVDMARGCLPECDGFIFDVACAPFPLGEWSCCSWVVYEPGQSCPGRPFIVDGHARLPIAVPRDDWATPHTNAPADLPPGVRAVLAEAWAADGCCEAASVASFSRFVLQLCALGAPARLLVQAQRAIAEEIEHAHVFFGLAQSYAGHALGPGPLSVDQSLDNMTSAHAIAVGLVQEGCVAETISAMQLHVAATRTSDAELRAKLERIAEQELQHAELAWATLGWMLARGSAALRSAVAELFADAQAFVPRAVSVSDDLPEAVLREAGRLGAEERLVVAERALRECIAPSAAALCAAWTTTNDNSLRASAWRPRQL